MTANVASTQPATARTDTPTRRQHLKHRDAAGQAADGRTRLDDRGGAIRLARRGNAVRACAGAATGGADGRLAAWLDRDEYHPCAGHRPRGPHRRAHGQRRYRLCAGARSRHRAYPRRCVCAPRAAAATPGQWPGGAWRRTSPSKSAPPTTAPARCNGRSPTTLPPACGSCGSLIPTRRRSRYGLPAVSTAAALLPRRLTAGRSSPAFAVPRPASSKGTASTS